MRRLLNASSLASLVQCSGSNEVEEAEVGEAEVVVACTYSVYVSPATGCHISAYARLLYMYKSITTKSM